MWEVEVYQVCKSSQPSATISNYSHLHNTCTHGIPRYKCFNTFSCDTNGMKSVCNDAKLHAN